MINYLLLPCPIDVVYEIFLVPTLGYKEPSPASTLYQRHDVASVLIHCSFDVVCRMVS